MSPENRNRPAPTRKENIAMKHVKIPWQWNAQEALSVVAFLNRIISAVWRQHGREMAMLLAYEHDFSSLPGRSDWNKLTENYGITESRYDNDEHLF